MVISFHCRIKGIKDARFVAVIVRTVVGLFVVKTTECSGHSNSMTTGLIYVYPSERADENNLMSSTAHGSAEIGKSVYRRK